MTKTSGNFTDFVSFSRASNGTALRRIAYGANEYTVANAAGDDTDATTGWTAASNAVLASQSANTNGSSFALLIESNTTPSSNGGAFTDMTSFGLTAGKLYELSVDYRHVGTGGRFSIQLASATNTADGPEIDTTINTADTTWATGTCLFVAGSTTSAYLRVREVNGTNDGGVYLDNVSVKEVLFDDASGDLVMFNHPDDIPRVEYDASGNVKGLLIEEQRTNAITYSEQFDDSSWAKNLATVTANQATAPDGTTTADLLVPSTASSNSHYVRKNTSSTSGNDYTMSVFAKAAGYTSLSLRLVNSDAPIVNYDLSAGTCDNAAGTIENVGNGWYRCSLTGNATTTGVWHYIYPNQQAAFAGDGTSGIYIWGSQTEAGSFATSYIPTSGASATRSADICSINVDQFGYNQKAGSVVVEAQLLYNPNSVQVPVFLGDNPSATINNSQLFFGDGTYRVRDSSGTTLAQIDAGSFSTSSFVKAIFTYNLNDFAASIDGGAVVSDTSGDPSNVSSATLSLSANPIGTILGHHIKSIAYYPRRLSNAQLQALTA